MGTHRKKTDGPRGTGPIARSAQPTYLASTAAGASLCVAVMMEPVTAIWIFAVSTMGRIMGHPVAAITPDTLANPARLMSRVVEVVRMMGVMGEVMGAATPTQVRAMQAVKTRLTMSRHAHDGSKRASTL